MHRRYEKQEGDGHPAVKDEHNGAPKKGHTLRLFAWEVTRSCALRCKHCRAAAEDRTYKCEITAESTSLNC